MVMTSFHRILKGYLVILVTLTLIHVVMTVLKPFVVFLNDTIGFSNKLVLGTAGRQSKSNGSSILGNEKSIWSRTSGDMSPRRAKISASFLTTP